MSKTRSSKTTPIVAVAGIAMVAVIVWLAMHAQTPPSGVQPVVWDKQTCAECGMAVSDRRFAAQLQTQDGRVHNFDDPGCLFDFYARHAADTHAIYFHRVDRDDEWLPAEQTGFVSAKDSPMGYGLGAVPRGTAGAISFDEAYGKSRHDTHGGPP